MQNTKWQQKIEYITLLASVIGTGIAAVTQQAIYATTPLTLALVVNTFNRHSEQEEQVQYRQQTISVKQSLEQVRNQYKELEIRFESELQRPILQDFNSTTTNLTNQVTQLQQELTFVKQQLINLQKTVNSKEVNKKSSFLNLNVLTNSPQCLDSEQIEKIAQAIINRSATPSPEVIIKENLAKTDDLNGSS